MSRRPTTNTERRSIAATLIEKENAKVAESFKDLLQFVSHGSFYRPFDIGEPSTLYQSPQHLLLIQLLRNPNKFDLYCPQCGCHRTFTQDTLFQSHNSEALVAIQSIHLIFLCAWDPEHKVQVYLHQNQTKLTKVGQHPSLADHIEPETKRFRNILGEEKHNELREGIRLHANGIGIGSYVYLRRVFEHLIEEARQVAQNSNSWNEEEYRSAKVAQKIQLLKDHLPDTLVDNAKWYSIVSKGLHELSEEECKQNFTLLKDTICLILDDKLTAVEKEKQKLNIQTQIGKLHSDLKGKNPPPL